MKNLILMVLILTSTITFSQEVVKSQDLNYNDAGPNKGKFFVYWGWNRDHYSTSDIKFSGADYKFTLYDVKADDKPKPFGIYFLKLDELTIPQTNFRIGYFLKEHYTVSIGLDHMKYVMRNDQIVRMNGVINTGGAFDGVYSNVDKVLTSDFLLFEHTDGLNYINMEVSRFDNLDNWLKFSVKNIDINLTEGIGVGILYPKTNTTLMGKELYDEFHVSGYGFSAHAGLNFTFFKHFFIQSNFKVGYINMQDIRTTKDKRDKATQHFTFIENMYVFGARFSLTK
ncbi:hypothetical protein [Lutibacter sp.]|uniref:hypothetical protein n=1 Tax=Lutibacter sp. TaxID=1925666 RepID=UPI0025B8800C|nr:hypothetical protein [Lutibacter sp.]MCF6181046.1 hypothetical protein [Lutibacter sp.]